MPRVSTLPLDSDFGPYHLLEQSQETRPTGRVDHQFVFERDDDFGPLGFVQRMQEPRGRDVELRVHELGIVAVARVVDEQLQLPFLDEQPGGDGQEEPASQR